MKLSEWKLEELESNVDERENMFWQQEILRQKLLMREW